MSDRDKSKEQLIQELVSLRRKVVALRTTKIVFDAQHQLMRTFVTTMQTASGTLMLRALLQQILNIASKLTDAETSSLFLLDADGVVIESILARGATLRGQKQRLIGEVLDKGFAGWVFRNRQIGLITDTMTDERWLTLPNQPYAVRSTLGVPILKGRQVLAILTLMHSQPEHFKPEFAKLMEMMAGPMALVLDNARLYNEQQERELESNPVEQQSDYKVTKTLSSDGEFSLIGLYILFGEGNFLYASPRLAEIFGYTFGELISLDSILELVTPDNRKFVADQISQCIQGQNKDLSFRFRGLRKDGNLINIEVYGTRTKLYGKFVIIGALRLI